MELNRKASGQKVSGRKRHDTIIVSHSTVEHDEVYLLRASVPDASGNV
jgi:hypothetical protein